MSNLATICKWTTKRSPVTHKQSAKPPRVSSTGVAADGTLRADRSGEKNCAFRERSVHSICRVIFGPANGRRNKRRRSLLRVRSNRDAGLAYLPTEKLLSVPGLISRVRKAGERSLGRRAGETVRSPRAEPSGTIREYRNAGAPAVSVLLRFDTPSRAVLRACRSQVAREASKSARCELPEAEDPPKFAL